MDALRNMLQSVWGRFRGAKRRTQIIIGVLAVVAVLGTCSGLVSAVGGGGTTTPTTQAPQATHQPIATSPPTQLPAEQVPTAQPTATPTATPEPPTPTATPKPAPTATPKPSTPIPQPTSPPNSGYNGNTWGYDFNLGAKIYIPPAEFCDRYFDCIQSFWNGKGYVVQCHDGQFSKSGGIRGVCSGHDGYWRTLYSH